MRILLFAHAFPPKSTGGAETYADAHARGLTGRGHQVTVFTREADRAAPEYASRVERRDGLEIIWINNTFGATRSFSETYANPAIDTVIKQAIDRCRPEVAHVHHLTCLSTGAVPLLRARGIPVVFTLHDYWLLCHRGQLLDTSYHLCRGPEPEGCQACLGPAARWGSQAFSAARAVRAVEKRLPETSARWLRQAVGRAAAITGLSSAKSAASEAAQRFAHMQALMRQVDLFLAPSEALRARFVSAGVVDERIRFWPCGHDPALFRGPSSRREQSGKSLRLGFIGSVILSKAPHLLLEAVADLRPGEVTADIFGAYSPYHGDDTYRSTLETLLAAANVRSHGPIPHQAVPDALRSLDVLVVPSVWPENSPLVIREAFLAGVPVVASRIGGIPEVVKDGVNGLLVRPGDPHALRSALRRLLDEPGLLETLKSGAKSSLVRTLDDDVEASERLYTSLRRVTGRREAVAAVVLHFGNPDETRLTVSALLASRRPIEHVVVVDNDPRRRCLAALHDLEDQIIYVSSPTNLGYPGGVNLGIREALSRGATCVFVVNNDVVVPPDVIGRLEQALIDDPRLGSVGPVVLSRGDPSRVASLGLSYNSTTGRMRELAAGTRSADLTLNGHPTRYVDGVSGCALLISKAALNATGLFDEEYFFGFEDLDWCLRAKRVGFDSAVVLNAYVHHEGGRSIGSDSAKQLYFAARNHLRLARRGGAPGRGRLAFRTLTIAGLNVAHAFRRGPDPLLVRLGAVARGVSDYIAGRSGPA